ncbi:hypothetical protein [Endozoicomonas atrinae]|uniref:hypothetical protein n=1 Tax=Endozoicomonas atrinae TaxID=1333660 RepID=UPI001586AEEA|nr:hypothetical protein [Endozoicomonas atrinae]
MLNAFKQEGRKLFKFFNCNFEHKENVMINPNLMGHPSAEDLIQITLDADRNNPNVDRSPSATAGSRYQSRNVMPVYGTLNTYVSRDQETERHNDFPDNTYSLFSGSQSNQNRFVSTYRGTINGHVQSFTSLSALLRMQPFMDKFRASAGEYLPDHYIPQNENDLRRLILDNDSIQQIFFMVNGIDVLNVSTISDESSSTLVESDSRDAFDGYRLPVPLSDRHRRLSIRNNSGNPTGRGPGCEESPSIHRVPVPLTDHSNTVATSNNSTQYSCNMNGDHKLYDSIDSLVAEQQLLRNFRDNARVYLENIYIPSTDAELKCLIKSSEDSLNVFILINEIETMPGANQIRWGNHATGLTSPLHNPLMDDVSARFRSLADHGAGRSVEFIRRFPRGVKSSFAVSEAGFYLSLKERKLVCYSCGGSINEWRDEWRDNNLNEVHAKLYPSCSYLKEKLGKAFIDRCQQQLTFEQRRLSAQPLANYPNLYCSPVTEDQLRQEEVEREQLKFMLDWRESRVTVDGMDLRQFERANTVQTQTAQGNIVRQRRQNHNATSSIERDVAKCMEQFHSCSQADPALHRAMDKLHRKVNASRVGKDELTLSLLQILQDLMALPEERVCEVGTEVAEMIDAALEGDCQDHTSEIIDQIKTRMALLNIKREMLDDVNGVTLSQLLKKLKLFYNESVLFRLMSETKVNGIPLIASGESTEIRGFLKNEFSGSICHFPENRIVQRYGAVGQQPREVMTELTKKFRSGINNQAEFENYIVNMFRTDPQLLEFLRKNDGEFPVWLGKTESNTELLMEEYSPGMAGLTEQEIIEGAANVTVTRSNLLNEDIEQFISDQVLVYWGEIIRETSI